LHRRKDEKPLCGFGISRERRLDFSNVYIIL
jgi:hypothetical protein